MRSLDQPVALESAGRLPDFLIVGAMKSGTTTLCQYLGRHPQIFLATPKEPQYFSRRFDTGEAGLAWYRSLFAAATPTQRCGEASTCYSRWPHFGDVAPRIASVIPSARLLYILRHPIDRAYSHYRHLMAERLNGDGGAPIGFEEALETCPEILDASRYIDQVERLLESFPRAQLCVILFEDLVACPSATLRHVQDFLEVEPLDLAAEAPLRANAWDERLATGRARRLTEGLRRAPVASALIDLLPVDFRRSVRARLTQPATARRLFGLLTLRQRARVSAFEPATRRMVGERLEGHTRRLAAWLERDLDHWLA